MNWTVIPWCNFATPISGPVWLGAVSGAVPWPCSRRGRSPTPLPPSWSTTTASWLSTSVTPQTGLKLLSNNGYSLSGHSAEHRIFKKGIMILLTFKILVFDDVIFHVKYTWILQLEKYYFLYVLKSKHECIFATIFLSLKYLQLRIFGVRFLFRTHPWSMLTIFTHKWLSELNQQLKNTNY